MVCTVTIVIQLSVGELCARHYVKTCHDMAIAIKRDRG